MYGLWLFKEIRTEYGYCKVDIYRKAFMGSAIEIGGFVGDSLSIALENLDTITAPVGKSVCSFAIYDTEQVEYDDLFSPDATAFKVVVSTRVGSGAYVTRWSGYVTPDFFAENLSYRTPISISARDNIGYLNDVDFDLTATTVTVRELIQSAFRKIAEDYPMSLSFVTQKQTAEGILAIDATISTTLLREMSWGEALETILHDLGLQMRWVDNNTIAVLDLSQIPEYYTTQGFNFIDASGYREIAPAWRELSQEQNYGVRENFFEGWLREDNITFVKTENIRIPLSMGGVTGLVPMRYYTPNNWGVAGNTFVINPKDYVYFGTYGQMAQPFGERIFFTGVEKDATNIANNYMSYRQDVYASNRPMRITFKAFTSVMATGGIGNNDALLAYDPANRFMDFATGDTLQLGLKVNLLLHVGTRTYILGQNWEEINGAETNSLYFVLPKIGQVDGSSVTPNEEEITIDVNTIPNDGVLELRIYGFTIHNKTNLQEDAGSATYDWLRMVSYINEVKYTYNIDNPDTGRYSQVEVNKQHNIKDTQSYTFGQIPVECGAVNAFAGGLYKSDGDELIGFQRNADATNYNLLELVGREIIHFNKRNYNRLSGTIRNLYKEPLMFNRLFVREGKKYAPYNYSLNVISNEMNITSMQEVEPYTTANFTEVNSEITTGGSTVSSGNNQILQYSAEVGNAKRLYELQTISEDERLDAYVLVDGAGYPEARKLKLTDIAGLDEKALEQYLVQYKYLQEADITPIIQGFEKLEEAVNPLFGYFDATGNANNALKLGGHSAEYFATADALNTHITAFNNYKIATNKRLDDLEALWYMDDDGNVHTTHNIIVEGGGAFGMGAESGDVPSASVSIKFEGSTIVYSPVDGIITLPAYPSGGGGVADSVDWANVYNKPTTLGGYGITDALSTSGGTISSSRPNPLVVNSTYANSQLVEIALSYNNTQKGFIGYYVDGAYIGDSVTGYRIGVRQDGEPIYKLSWSGVEHVLYHTGNFTPADYLPLSGGTIRGTLNIHDTVNRSTIKIVSQTNQPNDLWFGANSTEHWSLTSRDSAENYLFALYASYYNGGVNNYVFTANLQTGVVDFKYQPAVNGNAVIHSGNYSSYALPLSGGTISSSGFAPLNIKRDSTTGAAAIAYSGQSVTYGTLGFNDVTGPKWFDTSYNEYTLIHSGNIGDYAVKTNGDSTISNGSLSLNGGYIKFLMPDGSFLGGYNVSANTGNPIFSTRDSQWKTIAFTDSNVASATKLQDNTAFTAWGQTFFQNGVPKHVTGKLTLSSNSINEASIYLNCEKTSAGYNTINFSTAGETWGVIYGMDNGVGSKAWTYKNINISSNVITFGDWHNPKMMLYNETGNVLIGTTTDLGVKLQVYDSIAIQPNSGGYSGMHFYMNTNTKENWHISARGGETNHPFRLYYSPDNSTYNALVDVTKAGNVLIGTTTDNGAKLQVTGNLTVTGGGAFGSDIRYKDIISYRQLDLETIANAPLFTFKWTDREDKVEHLGTSAQYWLDTQFKDTVNATNKDFYHLDYGALAVGIGISVAREVKGVKTEVQLLREKVNQLEKELAQYRRA